MSGLGTTMTFTRNLSLGCPERVIVRMRSLVLAFAALLATGAHVAGLTFQASARVKAHQKISATEGGFTGALAAGDFFGISAASIGDFDGDGVGDVAVGAPFDADGGFVGGAVWLLFLRDDGTVRAHGKISATRGGFTGGLSSFDFFGSSVACLGDVDGDGVPDLAVGAAGTTTALRGPANSARARIRAPSGCCS